MNVQSSNPNSPRNASADKLLGSAQAPSLSLYLAKGQSSEVSADIVSVLSWKRPLQLSLEKIVRFCLDTFWPAPEPQQLSMFNYPVAPGPQLPKPAASNLDTLYHERPVNNLMSEIPAEQPSQPKQQTVANVSAATLLKGELTAVQPQAVLAKQVTPSSTETTGVRPFGAPTYELTTEEVGWVRHLAEQNKFLNNSIQRLTACSGSVD